MEGGAGLLSPVLTSSSHSMLHNDLTAGTKDAYVHLPLLSFAY